MDLTVRTVICIVADGQSGLGLILELHAKLPGIGREQAQNLMVDAYEICVSSKTLWGDVPITLVVD